MYQINFPQQSNASDWAQSIELADASTDTAIDLTGITITIVVRQQTRLGKGQQQLAAYGSNPNQPTSPVLSGSTNDGTIVVPIPANGVFTWTFRALTMSTLAGGQYEVGCVATDGTNTTQIFTGLLPIVEGVMNG